MDRSGHQDFFSGRMMVLWSVLAFQAGFINSIGFLACRRFVSHVTGFGSQFGIALGKGDYFYALEIFSVPVVFVLGAWLSGRMTVVQKARGLVPRYDRVTFLMAGVLAFTLLAGVSRLFGDFGEPKLLGHELVFPVCLAFVCGLQNACFATLTQGQIRTTHLTGISTDFGTDLALTMSGALSEGERNILKKKNFMRMLTFMSFSIGALISAILDARLEYWSLIVPLATSLWVAAYVVFLGKERSSEGLVAVEAGSLVNGMK